MYWQRDEFQNSRHNTSFEINDLQGSTDGPFVAFYPLKSTVYHFSLKN